ncbi:unnamed protein product, partial [Iphiclides podalirius]
MSLFGSLMADVEDDPFFGSHMRHMRQMNNMMNLLFSDPFSMMGGGRALALSGPQHNNSLMPFMPQMPSLNRLFSADLDGQMSAGSSFSSSTIVMSSGPNGKPQVFSSSSSTKIGPNGVKETRKTLQDTRTGTKKMSIGHHIGERAHLIEREQNYYSGEAEERQEFINIEEEEAEDFDREFQTKAGAAQRARQQRAALAGLRAPSPPPAHQRLALPAPPSPHAPHAHASSNATPGVERARGHRPTARRPLRSPASPLAAPRSSSVRDVYGGPHPQSHRHRQPKPAHRHSGHGN